MVGVLIMAFRTGGFSGKGTVYSRRRGRGPVGSNVLRTRTSIIYEETEEDTDLEVQGKMNQQGIRQADMAKTIGISEYGNRVLYLRQRVEG